MKWKYLYIWVIGLLAIGCFDDDTTVDTVRISEVAIDTNSLQKEYNRDKNQTLVIDITPYVTQKEKDLPLTFQWDIDYKFYSDSSVLYLDCQELGTFPMRVKVSNEHSSAFYEFKLHVNSPYEEGIAVLSEGSDGTGMLSFMRQMADGTMGNFETRCLTTNNPGEVFPKSPTDMAKRASQLFISYKDDPSIYIVNAKTFELENIVKAPEFSDFLPVAIMIPDNTACTAIALSENGKAYNLASMEGLILTHTTLTSTYSSVKHDYFGGYNPLYYLWDTDLHTICYYNGYTVDNCTKFGAIWNENHEVVAIFENEKGSSFTVLTRKNGEIWKTSLGNYIYLQDPDTYQNVGIDYRDVQRVISNPVLKKEDPKVASPSFQCLFYAQGNKIYCWYYSSTSFPTESWATIDDISNAEITTMAISPDESQVYVGAYRSDESGENGYIYIYDTRTGRLINSYKNVAYKPIKIMYKVK